MSLDESDDKFEIFEETQTVDLAEDHSDVSFERQETIENQINLNPDQISANDLVDEDTI